MQDINSIRSYVNFNDDSITDSAKKMMAVMAVVAALMHGIQERTQHEGKTGAKGNVNKTQRHWQTGTDSQTEQIVY